MSDRLAEMGIAKGIAILSSRLPPTEGEQGQKLGGLRSEDGQTVVAILFANSVPKKKRICYNFIQLAPSGMYCRCS